ncbi:MAG: flagellar basal body L-ring protein FlgH, partial [Pyrinomonadaceae bacterium]
MKYKALITLTLIAIASAAVISQTKPAKKSKKKDQPKLTVVEVNEAPPVVPDVVILRPTNGSLFTDNATNNDLLRDFKARQVGDLVFVDVVETNTATVSSNASRSRDSGNLAGIVPLVTALPINGAAIA